MGPPHRSGTSWAQQCTFKSGPEALLCPASTLEAMLAYARSLKYTQGGISPLTLTPCDFFQAIRGRTLWLLG